MCVRLNSGQDVFLTTMKPQQKVVTAQDVQSSLYYLHVASPSDYDLLQEHDADEEPKQACPAINPVSMEKTNISRKPVPRNPNLGPSNQPGLPHQGSPRPETIYNGSNGDIQALTRPVDQRVRPGHRSLDIAPKLPLRKLLGPRSMNPRLHPVDNSVLQDAPGRQNIDTRRWSEQPAKKPPQLPPRPSPTNDRDMDASSGREEDTMRIGVPMREQVNPRNNALPAGHCWEWEKSWEAKRASEARAEMAKVTSGWRDSQETLRDTSAPTQDASLSLIRRYNGEQWNVAKIECTGQRHSLNATPDLGEGILVDILTPGYSKFVNMKDPNDEDPFPKTAVQLANLHEEGKPAFRRQLQHYKIAKRPKLFNNTDPSEPELAVEHVRPDLESNRQSSDSIRASIGEQSAQKQTSSNGYVIGSPWNGICEFSAGIAGRSLKCRHAYASTNPKFGAGTFSATVSELRFNLPSSKAFGTPTAKTPGSGTPRGGKRSSLFLRPHQQRTSSFETDQAHGSGYFGAKVELEDRLDLSLGQEHAGGGFGGKQAKLGKLIVEVEGLQMLDLVVAANMALWWRVYKRIA